MRMRKLASYLVACRGTGAAIGHGAATTTVVGLALVLEHQERAGVSQVAYRFVCWFYGLHRALRVCYHIDLCAGGAECQVPVPVLRAEHFHGVACKCRAVFVQREVEYPACLQRGHEERAVPFWDRV